MLAKNPAFNLTISLVMKQEDGFTKINSKKTEEKKKRKYSGSNPAFITELMFNYCETHYGNKC